MRFSGFALLAGDGVTDAVWVGGGNPGAVAGEGVGFGGVGGMVAAVAMVVVAVGARGAGGNGNTGKLDSGAFACATGSGCRTSVAALVARPNWVPGGVPLCQK